MRPSLQRSLGGRLAAAAGNVEFIDIDCTVTRYDGAMRPPAIDCDGRYVEFGSFEHAVLAVECKAPLRRIIALRHILHLAREQHRTVSPFDRARLQRPATPLAIERELEKPCCDVHRLRQIGQRDATLPDIQCQLATLNLACGRKFDSCIACDREFEHSEQRQWRRRGCECRGNEIANRCFDFELAGLLAFIRQKRESPRPALRGNRRAAGDHASPFRVVEIDARLIDAPGTPLAFVVDDYGSVRKPEFRQV